MWTLVYYTLAAVVLTASGHIHDETAKINRYMRSFEGALDPGIISAIGATKLPRVFRSRRRNTTPLGCYVCTKVMDIIIGLQRFQGPSSTITDKSIYRLCNRMHIETKQVCAGVAALYGPSIRHLMYQSPYFNGQKVCSVIFQGLDCTINDPQWTIKLPPKAPASTPKAPGNGTLKILHFSDVHLDPDYETDSNALCDEPLCCQKGTVPVRGTRGARHWGDYRFCDTPLRILRSALEYFMTKQTPDFVYMTGDLAPHRVWYTSSAFNKEIIGEALYWIKYYFGKTNVYPVLGDLDASPAAAFPPLSMEYAKSSQAWLYDVAGVKWKSWLPDDTSKTIFHAGYYTVSPRSGFRIIALNNNGCSILNVWNLVHNVDPLGQLTWLVKILTQAEKDGEIVHIISHMAINDPDCYINCCKEYAKIIRRFHHIIAGQFHGNTHLNDIAIQYEGPTLSNPINAAFISGGFSPYGFVNPSFRVYTVDSQTFEVLDAELFSYDIEESGKTTQWSPTWKSIYSLKKLLGVNNFFKSNLHKIIPNLIRNRNTAAYYDRFKHSDVRNKKMGCDRQCELNNLCDIVTTYHGDDNCNKIIKMYAEYVGMG